MADADYEYTNERSIDAGLKCSICYSPFNDPHRTQCGHTYCKECITDWIVRNIRCPLCRQSIRLTDLKKAEETSNAINRLLVTCKKCGQSDIHRDEFNDHIRNDCSKTHCPIKNLQKIELLINQPARQIQRLRKELERQKTDINNNNTEMNNTLKTIHEKLQKQQDEIQTLRQSNDIQQKRIQELQRKLKTQEEQIQEQEESIVQLERDNRCLYENSNESNTQIRNLEEKIKELLPYEHNDLEEHITDNCQFGSEFSLPRDNLIDRDMEIIVKRAIINRQCSALDLRKNKITFQGTRIIADAFHQNIRLEKLDLSYNNISDRGVQYIAEALLDNITLKELYLGSTGITNQGIKYLQEMLQINKTLKKLYLYQNYFDDDGIKLLTNVLSKHNTTLNKLVIHSNRLTDQSVKTIIDMFRESRSLYGIEIDKCHFSNEGKTRLRDAARNASISIDI